ncbi:MAG: dTDP-4-keto-6-deoxy-D-glucose epimerase, partial [Chitinophagaceae bacterium]
ESPTFKQWIGVELTAETYRMLYVPEGFAHGFLTLEDNTDVTYQVTQFYTPAAERGFRWDDPAFGIQWPFAPRLVSAKDEAHAPFEPAALVMQETPATS